MSQYVAEASLPWHAVNSNVHKQTRGMSFTFICTRIKIKYNYNIIQINTEFVQKHKVSITSDTTL